MPTTQQLPQPGLPHLNVIKGLQCSVSSPVLCHCTVRLACDASHPRVQCVDVVLEALVLTGLLPLLALEQGHHVLWASGAGARKWRVRWQYALYTTSRGRTAVHMLLRVLNWCIMLAASQVSHHALDAEQCHPTCLSSVCC
jgi:hypothetical protein